MPAPTQCQSSAWPGPHPSAFFALGGIQDSTNDCSQKEKADHVSMIGLYLCRQRPTLPHTFACSTIGPAGLNFRVRDGNGWIPRGKITDKLRRFAGVNLPPKSGAFFRKGSRFALSVSLVDDDFSKILRTMPHN